MVGDDISHSLGPDTAWRMGWDGRWITQLSAQSHGCAMGMLQDGSSFDSGDCQLLLQFSISCPRLNDENY